VIAASVAAQLLQCWEQDAQDALLPAHALAPHES
jgi:hypothetical protein